MFNNFIPLWEKFHEFKSLFEYNYKINLHVELFYSYLLFVTKMAKYIENVLSTVFSVHPLLQWGNFLHFHCWPINLSNCLQIVRFSFEVLILQGKTEIRVLKASQAKFDEIGRRKGLMPFFLFRKYSGHFSIFSCLKLFSVKPETSLKYCTKSHRICYKVFFKMLSGKFLSIKPSVCRKSFP